MPAPVNAYRAALLREWAYARAYQSSAERGHAMQPWIIGYNHTRPHSALGGKPPLEKLNNVLGFDTSALTLAINGVPAHSRDLAEAP